MKRLIKLIAIWVSALLPYPIWASLPSQQQVGEGRLQNWRWPFLVDKLASNRMPQSYYDFLLANGVTSSEQLKDLDENIKTQLLKMYRDDLIVIAGKSNTRSIW